MKRRTWRTRRSCMATRASVIRDREVTRMGRHFNFDPGRMKRV
jgi:hypothetical protein